MFTYVLAGVVWFAGTIIKLMKTSIITRMTARCGECGTTITFPLAAEPAQCQQETGFTFLME